MTVIDFIQVNTKKAFAAAVELNSLVTKKKEYVCLVSEPYVFKEKVCAAPPSCTIASGKNPRAAIFGRKSLNLIKIDHLTNRDCAVALLRTKERDILLASVYMDIKLAMVPKWLEEIEAFASSKKYPVIIGMDSNAHSSLYGLESNKRGEELEEFIINKCFVVENIGKKATFSTRRGDERIETVIDVTLSRGMNDHITRWNVDTGFNGSDHKTITYTLTNNTINKDPVRLWDSIEWEAFTQNTRKCRLYYPQSITEKKLDKMVKCLYDVINISLDITNPKTPKDSKNRDFFWFTNEHQKIKARVNKLYIRAIKSRKEDDRKAYKKEQKYYKKKCKKDRRNAWHRYLDGISSAKEIAKLTKILNKKERECVTVFEKETGGATEIGSETLDTLLKTHFKSMGEITHVKYNSDKNTPTDLIQEMYNDWINGDKIIKLALEGFDGKKSPGPDEIKPLLFKYLDERILEYINIIYKACIFLHYTPIKWKETKVIFIPKPGKSNYRLAKSFRPISLSNYFLKGLERLVGWKMDEALIKYPIHPKQHGFTVGKSTESAISNTVNFIEKYVFKNQYALGIFLDISSAFDSIDPDHIREALMDHDLSLIHI